MSRGVLALDGVACPHYAAILRDADFVVCADGAIDWVRALCPELHIHAHVGDFDSASLQQYDNVGVRCAHPTDKDNTDGQLALDYLMDNFACQSIVIVGAIGGRTDHMLANFALLHRAHMHPTRPKASICDPIFDIYLTDGHFCATVSIGKTVSLVPFGGCANIIDTKGLLYAVSDRRFGLGTIVPICNQATEEQISVSLSEGFALVLVER